MNRFVFCFCRYSLVLRWENIKKGKMKPYLVTRVTGELRHVPQKVGVQPLKYVRFRFFKNGVDVYMPPKSQTTPTCGRGEVVLQLPSVRCLRAFAGYPTIDAKSTRVTYEGCTVKLCPKGWPLRFCRSYQLDDRFTNFPKVLLRPPM